MTKRDCAPPLRWNRAHFNYQLQERYYYHEIASGAISKGSISWFMSLRVLAKRFARGESIVCYNGPDDQD
jgi:hypothetical protein